VTGPRCALGWLTEPGADCAEPATAIVHARALVALACAPHAGLALLCDAEVRTRDLPERRPAGRRVTRRRAE
jgi:hypothetical protein